ncbi:MAG TPA: PAAR domain-containing protein [Gemmatirosa sp.]
MPADLTATHTDVDHAIAAHQAAQAQAAQAAAPPPDALEHPIDAALASTGLTGPPGGGVAGRWWKGVQDSAHNLFHPDPPPASQTGGQHAASVVRNFQGVVGGVMGALGMPLDMMNTGFANLTAPLAALFPSFPAATLGMLYVGMPHTHVHPPSLIPPAPPIPLPSLGPISLGVSVKVLIGGAPAARAGDLGIAPTCGGFTPFFQIKTGSSNVFIGGNRAARMLDVCTVCVAAPPPAAPISAGAIMGAVGSVARVAEAAIKYGGVIVQAVGMAADLTEAAVDDSESMAAAKALSAGMAAAQMAADAAKMALSAAMGKDPGGPPVALMGAVTLGQPNVLIGGFPMVNFPNPVDMLLGRLARYKRTPPPPQEPPSQCTTGNCPSR